MRCQCEVHVTARHAEVRVRLHVTHGVLLQHRCGGGRGSGAINVSFRHGTAPLLADRIILGTGATVEVTAIPLLRDAIDRFRLPIVDELPDLDESLQWGGESFSVVGALALLQIGPEAGNLAGCRRAAERCARDAHATAETAVRRAYEAAEAARPALEAPLPALDGLGVKALKGLCAERGVDVSRCLEKGDIIDALRASAPGVAAPPAARCWRRRESHESLGASPGLPDLVLGLEPPTFRAEPAWLHHT